MRTSKYGARIGRPPVVWKPTTPKRCTKCGGVKLAGDFYWSSVVGVAGGVYHRPGPWCKACTCEERHRQLKIRGKEINELRKKRYVLRAPTLRRRTAEWQRENPEKMAVIKEVRHRRLMAACAKKYSKAEHAKWLSRAIERQSGRCYYCGSACSSLETDHRVPICRGGRHEEANIVASCRSCNASKGTQTDQEYNAN